MFAFLFLDDCRRCLGVSLDVYLRSVIVRRCRPDHLPASVSRFHTLTLITAEQPETLVCVYVCVCCRVADWQSVNNWRIKLTTALFAVGNRLWFAAVNIPPAPLHPWAGSVYLCVLAFPSQNHPALFTDLMSYHKKTYNILVFYVKWWYNIIALLYNNNITI